MACCEPTTSDDAGRQGLDIAAKMQQHETLTREIYGRSLDEFLAMAFREGRAAGYRGGRVDGYRAAKGRKKSSKITAKTVIALTVEKIGWGADPKLLEQTAIEVLHSIAVGHAHLSNRGLPKDVIRFLKAQRYGLWPEDWPKASNLRCVYSRQRAKLLRTQ